MLDFIKNALQTILNAIDSDLTVTIQNVNSFDKAIKAPEDKLIQIVYRELPGLMPSMQIKDRIINGTLTVVALEKYKETVIMLFSIFVETYNATFQTDRKLQFTNLVPIGLADNIGSKIYQTWQMSVIANIQDKMATLFDKSLSIVDDDLYIDPTLKIISAISYVIEGDLPIFQDENELVFTAIKKNTTLIWSGIRLSTVGQIFTLNIAETPAYNLNITIDGQVRSFVWGTNLHTATWVVGERTFVIKTTITPYQIIPVLITMDYENGLTFFNVTKTAELGRYPTSALIEESIVRYTKYIVTISFYDTNKIAAQYFKNIIYTERAGYLIQIQSGSNSMEFNAKVVSANETATEAFPILTITFERG
jgi:hypothetical protein